MPEKDPTYLFTPFDGTPGAKFESWEEKVFNAAAGIVDDRGWSATVHTVQVYTLHLRQGRR